MTKRRAYILAAASFLFILGLTAFVFTNINIGKILPAQIVQPGFYRVVDVDDGDTISVDMSGKIERVRMIGVDTPETHHPDYPVQCYGPEASDFTDQLLNGKTVRLEADPTNQNRDRYDRLLRYVYTEQGELVNLSLIEKGYGFSYLSFTFEKADQFGIAGEQAKEDNVGLWAICQPSFKDGRWQSNSL